MYIRRLENVKELRVGVKMVKGLTVNGVNGVRL
jgi:hypothetical protein